MTKFKNYFCIRTNNCLVSTTNRNLCRSCRFKKCLQVGMSKKAIKMGRKTNKEKQKDKQMLRECVFDVISSLEINEFYNDSLDQYLNESKYIYIYLYHQFILVRKW